MINRLIYTVITFLSLSFFSCQEKLDWNPNYKHYETSPYGAQSLYELLPEKIGEEFQELKGFSQFCPESLKDTIGTLNFDSLTFWETDSMKVVNLSIVKNSLELSQKDINIMELAIRNGAHVVLASENFGESLRASYGFSLTKDTNWQLLSDTAIKNIKKTTVVFNNGLETSNYELREQSVSFSIQSRNNFTPLLVTENDTKILAIKKQMGKGSLIISSVPKIFTNFHFLHFCPELVTSFYADFEKIPTYWGNSYRGFDDSSFESDKGLLDFIKKYPGLLWAWYLSIAGGVLFVLSNMRRIQNPLKKMPQNENMSMQFVETVAQLYRKSSHHGEIYRKKVNLFYAEMFVKYDVKRTQDVDSKAHKIAKRSGRINRLEELKVAIQFIDNTYNQEKVKDEEYTKAFQFIEKIKQEYL